MSGNLEIRAILAHCENKPKDAKIGNPTTPVNCIKTKPRWRLTNGEKFTLEMFFFQSLSMIKIWKM